MFIVGRKTLELEETLRNTVKYGAGQAEQDDQTHAEGAKFLRLCFVHVMKRAIQKTWWLVGGKC